MNEAFVCAQHPNVILVFFFEKHFGQPFITSGLKQIRLITRLFLFQLTVCSAHSLFD